LEQFAGPKELVQILLVALSCFMA